mgnify:CR=1 FL=1
MHDGDGDLEVDLAELSLGQRLTAVDGPVADSDDSDNDAPNKKSAPKSKSKAYAANVVPANSLTRTLIQALHSSDARLLETCLAHSDPVLIQNTLRRLPPQLAVPLITACTERLGRGGRAANMKGGGGGASAQRGTSLIIWIKTVLAVHAGHLMTVSLPLALVTVCRLSFAHRFPTSLPVFPVCIPLLLPAWHFMKASWPSMVNWTLSSPKSSSDRLLHQHPSPSRRARPRA